MKTWVAAAAIAALMAGCQRPGGGSPPGRPLDEYVKLIGGLTKPDVEKALGPPHRRIGSGGGYETWWVYRDAVTTPNGTRHLVLHFNFVSETADEVAALTTAEVDAGELAGRGVRPGGPVSAHTGP